MDAMIDGYLEKGEYYNAQMMYKTLAFRHKKRGAYGEAVALLAVGAERLLRGGQYLGGSELGQLMVQVRHTPASAMRRDASVLTCLRADVHRGQVPRDGRADWEGLGAR
jgi:hypothetical protein